jgi:hypothetical protein
VVVVVVGIVVVEVPGMVVVVVVEVPGIVVVVDVGTVDVVVEEEVDSEVARTDLDAGRSLARAIGILAWTPVTRIETITTARGPRHGQPREDPIIGLVYLIVARSSPHETSGETDIECGRRSQLEPANPRRIEPASRPPPRHFHQQLHWLVVTARWREPIAAPRRAAHLNVWVARGSLLAHVANTFAWRMSNRSSGHRFDWRR